MPDVDEIIKASVAANRADFNAADHFDWKERDSEGKTSKTFQVTQLYGTPYNRLLAVNGKPLSPQSEEQQIEKQKQEAERRRAESPEARRERIEKYEKDRQRDNNMMDQLTQAFSFRIVGATKDRGSKVWVLNATPRPGYKAPNRDAQVLPGMRGKLWIDQTTNQWVHVHATVVQPVSIAGFLAQVEPGTAFDLRKSPVSKGVWMPSHFSMKAQAKVFFMFSHNSQEDDTFWDYQPATSEPNGAIGAHDRSSIFNQTRSFAGALFLRQRRPSVCYVYK